MQTVNFQCGHCRNLMAVSTDCLGQQVRCPHCQQVVVAPTPAAPFAPAPDDSSPAPPSPFQTLKDHEDIFTVPPAGDDLFGAPPRLEIPRDAAPSPAPLPVGSGNGAETAAQAPPPEAEVPGATTLSYPYPEEPAAPGPGVDAAGGPFTDGPQAADTEEVALRTPGGRHAPAPQGGGWFIPLVFLPLLLYAILATIALALLLLRQQPRSGPNLFEQMPDFGDTPGVKKAKSRVTINVPVRTVTAPLPAMLLTKLGRAIRVGDLEVTPERVERKKVKVFVEGSSKPEPCLYDSLVLHLKLRNVSQDGAFTPLDNCFDRYWREGEGPPPFTLLEAGKDRFFGGPAKWFPRGPGGRSKERRQWLQGRKDYDEEGLQPGAQMQSFVCTDGQDERVGLVLFGVDEDGKAVRPPYQGPLLWRVHVRRGLIDYQGRPVSATAVVGVEFSDEDYLRKNAG
jgi:hypothetical protein